MVILNSDLIIKLNLIIICIHINNDNETVSHSLLLRKSYNYEIVEDLEAFDEMQDKSTYRMKYELLILNFLNDKT